jgi:hypothetical protein
VKGNRAGSRWILGLSVALLALAGCSRQEAADWKQATLADSSEAYQLFLQQHPHSAEATQAQARVQQLAEQRDWQVASAADTRDSYQLFLKQHADSKWTQEARIRIENFAQAGVSGGAALAEAAGTPGGLSPAAVGANDASVNDASPPAGTPGVATTAPAPVANATVVGGDGTAATPPLAATVAPRVATALAASGSGSAHHERVPAGRTHATRHPAARLARSDAHRGHSKLVARTQASSRTLQLGAFRSRASAESEWHHLVAHNATLKGLRPRYVAASAHAGRVYRLEVRVSSVAAANGVCASLHRRARSCVRVIA